MRIITLSTGLCLLLLIIEAIDVGECLIKNLKVTVLEEENAGVDVYLENHQKPEGNREFWSNLKWMPDDNGRVSGIAEATRASFIFSVWGSSGKLMHLESQL